MYFTIEQIIFNFYNEMESSFLFSCISNKLYNLSRYFS